jgi:hypothetical protein
LRTYTGDITPTDAGNSPIEKVKNQSSERKVDRSEQMARISKQIEDEGSGDPGSGDADDFFNMDDIEL